MLSFRHFFFHSWGPWFLRAEIPIWAQHNLSSQAVNHVVGNQPWRVQQYYQQGDPVLYQKNVPDLDYRLVGKLVEQHRTCQQCHLTDYKWKKVTV